MKRIQLSSLYWRSLNKIGHLRLVHQFAIDNAPFIGEDVIALGPLNDLSKGKQKSVISRVYSCYRIDPSNPDNHWYSLAIRLVD